MTTSHDVLYGVIEECSGFISKYTLTGKNKSKPFRRHNPDNMNGRRLEDMAGMESLRMFEWGIPVKIGEPMCGVQHKIVQYEIPLSVSYPDVGEWRTFAFQDAEMIIDACDPLTNAYTVTGCAFRQMAEAVAIVEQKERGAFLVSSKLQVIAEIDT